jgi:single stranded DNA-binding protein
MKRIRESLAIVPMARFSYDLLAASLLRSGTNPNRKRPLPSPPATAGRTGFLRVAQWRHGLGRLAEVVNQYMGKGKRVRVIGRLEYQTWNDKITGEPRSRAVIVASQVLFLDYDRAHTGLAEEPEAEEQVIEQATQPDAEQPAQPQRSRRKQAA